MLWSAFLKKPARAEDRNQQKQNQDSVFFAFSKTITFSLMIDFLGHSPSLFSLAKFEMWTLLVKLTYLKLYFDISLLTKVAWEQKESLKSTWK